MELSELKEIMPDAKDEWALPLLAEMPWWGIKGMHQEAAFLANIAEETRGLTVFEEDLNYTTEEALRKALHSRWDALDIDDAWGYLRQPERLANRVYSNRMGNGDEESGDGWRYRGMGPAMLTGRDNYMACGHGIGHDLLAGPDLLLSPETGARSACWFWRSRGLSKLADAGDFHAVCKRWNGGTVGLASREDHYGKALEVLA